MEKLKELYALKKQMQELGVTNDAIQLIQSQIREKEEEEINKKVLPRVKEVLEPILQAVQTEVNILVTYSTENGLSVKLVGNKTMASFPNTNKGYIQHRKNMSCDEAIMQVFKDNNYEPMHYKEITEEIIRKKYIDYTRAKTPELSVCRNLSEGRDRFERLGNGYYRLKQRWI
ncbi:MAG: winged helix-turn-helix domain-containing protein [Coprobacter sp.]|nr:winged helix-turn-helix domain-containing protein [Coprobacter sp.]